MVKLWLFLSHQWQKQRRLPAIYSCKKREKNTVKSSNGKANIDGSRDQYIYIYEAIPFDTIICVTLQSHIKKEDD